MYSSIIMSSMRKINVIGTTGSGKSTFTRALAERLGVTCIEMDSLFWQPNWGETPDQEFFAALEQALDCDGWVLDGNYTRTIPIKWKHVDTVIWLDYGFFTNLFRISKRSIQRSLSGDELWAGTGNRESFRKLFSRDSIMLWFFKAYWKNKRRYVLMMEDAQYAHIKFIRLRSPKDAQQLLDGINP